MGVVGVMSHGDGVVDRRPDVRGLRRGGWMSLLVHQGGSVKCEAEATLDADEEVGAARGAVEGVAVTHGTGGGARAVRGTSWGAIEEG
jgi:hypothetical protein